LEVAARLWHRFVNWLGDFLEEAAFRMALAFKVLDRGLADAA
jgi:hypothetical protein